MVPSDSLPKITSAIGNYQIAYGKSKLFFLNKKSKRNNSSFVNPFLISLKTNRLLISLLSISERELNEFVLGGSAESNKFRFASF